MLHTHIILLSSFMISFSVLDFLQVLLSKVLYEDCMTFLPECGADKSLYFISDSNSPTHLWIHNDSMYVRFGGIRNTKTWSKSISVYIIWEIFLL